MGLTRANLGRVLGWVFLGSSITAITSGVVLAQDPKVSVVEGKPFSAELAKVFAHPRCVNCHEMADPKSETYRTHLYQARIQSTTNVSGSSVCSFCHVRPEIVSVAWKAPAIGFDFRPLLDKPGELCRTLKARPQFKGDPDALRKHLLTNELVRWGIENGHVPDQRDMSSVRRLENAVPGGRRAWMKMLRAWKRSGYACGEPVTTSEKGLPSP